MKVSWTPALNIPDWAATICLRCLLISNLSTGAETWNEICTQLKSKLINVHLCIENKHKPAILVEICLINEGQHDLRLVKSYFIIYTDSLYNKELKNKKCIHRWVEWVKNLVVSLLRMMDNFTFLFSTFVLCLIFPAFATILVFILSFVLLRFGVYICHMKCGRWKTFLTCCHCAQNCFNCRHIDSSYVIIMWQASVYLNRPTLFKLCNTLKNYSKLSEQ